MGQSSLLFSEFKVKGLTLKNRITMAPMYVGYAYPAGEVTELALDHYREMAGSGAAMIVVENAGVHELGLGSRATIRADHDKYVPGLAKLAKAIKDEGAIAVLQINHAGRYAYHPDKFAPSPVETGFKARGIEKREIGPAIEAFALAARRVKDAGFDGVELHGGTGYLLVQFLSLRTNQRDDEYGGPLENRMRFPLAVVDAVMEAAGDFPVGYRFLADEGLPDGLHTDETSVFAKELEKRDIAYLSVMAGTYDAFFTKEWMQRETNEAYMSEFAAKIKKAVPDTPVITAGRIQSPETAEKILKEGQADLIGLARVLLADPLWPKKAKGEIADPIVKCEPTCSMCLNRVTRGKPAYCSQWDKQRKDAFKERIGEPKKKKD